MSPSSPTSGKVPIRPLLLAIGGAHVDRRGRVTGDYAPSASNPGRFVEDVGGGAFNALRTAVRRGVAGALLSLRGGDAAGETVGRAVQAAGIRDLSVCYLDRATPSYTALIDRHGDLIAALADMELYDFGFAKQMSRRAFRDAAGQADAILVDANLPEAALVKVARTAGDKPLFAIAVSPAKVIRLRPILPSLACLFMNGREAASLVGVPDRDEAGFAKALVRSGLRAAVITGGAGSIVCVDATGVRRVAPPPARLVADVTGAGDALAGAAIAALLGGAPLAEAVRDGAAAALLAVETARTVPDFTPDEFARARAAVDLAAAAAA